MSSIQSVPGQPEVASHSSTTHHAYVLVHRVRGRLDQASVDRSEFDERRHGFRLVARDLDLLAEVLERTNSRELGHLARSWEAGDIGRGAARDAFPQAGAQVARAGVLDGDAGLLLERPDHCQKRFLFAATPRTDHADRAPEWRGGCLRACGTDYGEQSERDEEDAARSVWL